MTELGKAIAEAYAFEGDSLDLGRGVHEAKGVPEAAVRPAARDVESARADRRPVAHIEDVEWGVLETSGQISFIPKSAS